MKTTNNSVASIAAAALLLGTGTAFAAPFEITQTDYDPTLYGFNGNGSLNSGGSASQGNFGIAKEDNETERGIPSLGPGTIAGQQWDMEAFVKDGKKLTIIAGFDLLNGVSAHAIGAGDLFIKVGGSQPTFLPTANTTANISNAAYGWNYVVDLSLLNAGNKHTNVSFGPTAAVYSLAPTSMVATVQNDYLGSNPWKYVSGGTSLGGAALTYATNQTSSQISTNYNLSLQGTYHNALTIDLSFLGTISAGTPVYFSYTMECGNDSLKGRTNAGFFQVPDATSSYLLIALGLASVAIFGYKRRR